MILPEGRLRIADSRHGSTVELFELLDYHYSYMVSIHSIKIHIMHHQCLPYPPIYLSSVIRSVYCFPTIYWAILNYRTAAVNLATLDSTRVGPSY